MTYPPLAEVLAAHGLTGVAEEPLQTDGWSGARMTRLERADGARFVIKRDSLALDWIARETGDVPDLREAALAHAGPGLRRPSACRISASAGMATSSGWSCPTSPGRCSAGSRR
jgi:hypothetical protein